MSNHYLYWIINHCYMLIINNSLKLLHLHSKHEKSMEKIYLSEIKLKNKNKKGKDKGIRKKPEIF